MALGVAEIMSSDSLYYKDTGKLPFASKVSALFRKKMFARFMAGMLPDPDYRILDVGVTCDEKHQESNYFENLYPHKDKIVCVGTEAGGYLEKKYPGIKFIRVEPHKPLPFRDKEFDIVFSNAVIEHVGSRGAQKAFVLEMLRVGKFFFLTTPNRWCPVELHTAIPLLHYFPERIYRGLLSALGETYWNREENLNLLTRKELKSLFPAEVGVVIGGVGCFGLTTNLLAYGASQKADRRAVS